MRPPSSIPLLDSKFVPQLGIQPLLPRARLALPAALMAGPCSVASVVAPAGYGKTTMLAQWYDACDPAQRAWLNLDEHDNDPLRLMRYLIGALQFTQPQVGADALPHMNGPVLGSAVTCLEILAGDLGSLAQPLLLFIDDAHWLTDPAAVAILDWLLLYAPRQLRIVAGSRHAPPLALATVRLRGRLIEYGQADLAFTAGEAGSFCDGRLALPLTGPGLQRLMDKTEGWPAALELALQALRGAADPLALLEDFCGAERGIVDYLGEVVFARLGMEQRRWIDQCALFDRFCAALIRDIADDQAAAEFIADMNRRQLFLLGMDRSGTWFRFHPLVADYLRRHPPPGAHAARIAALTAGSRWFHAQGHGDDAINCAIRAEDWALACGWLAETVHDAVQRRGAHAPLQRWMRQIPAAWLDRFPAIRLNHAFSLILTMQFGQAEAELHAVGRRVAALRGEAGAVCQEADWLESEGAMHRLMLAGVRDESAGMLAAARDWLQRWPQAPLHVQGYAHNAASFGCKLEGEIGAGLDHVRQGRAILTQEQGYYGLAWSAMFEALLHLKAGQYREARDAAQAGLALDHQQYSFYAGHIAIPHTILAAVAYEFDEIAEARCAIEFDTGSNDALALADVLILAYQTRARLQFCDGHADAGMQALRLGRQMARRRNLRRVEIALAAEECIWLARHSERDAALAVAQQFGFDRAIHARYDMVADKSARVGPRLSLLEAPELALAQLGQPLQRASERGYHRRYTELLLLKAAALLHCGREAEALDAFAAVLADCERFGYRRIVLDDPDLCAALFQAARGKQDIAAPAWLAAKGPVLPATGEALTRKELRILKHLESGLPNRDIAMALFISEGTLKWHLHNIYRKLNCRNRTRALVEARRAGLL